MNHLVLSLMERTGCSWDEAEDILWAAAEDEADRRRDDEAMTTLQRRETYQPTEKEAL